MFKRISIYYLLAATVVFALHEEQSAPARMLGMGGVVVATGNGAEAVPFNPAIAADIERYSLTGTYSSRWSLEGFSEYSAGFAFPFDFGNFAANWHERSVADIYGERTMGITFARSIIENLDGGISAKLLMTSATGAETWADPAYDGARYSVAFDIGLLWKSHRNWCIGLSGRNLNEPEMKLLSTSEKGDPAGRQLALGTAWEVAPDFVLAGDLVSEEGSIDKWQPRLGMEIIFFKTLSVRAGARGERLGLGAGIKAKHWAFDAALANHRWLGNIYRFTLTLEY